MGTECYTCEFCEKSCVECDFLRCDLCKKDSCRRCVERPYFLTENEEDTIKSNTEEAELINRLCGLYSVCNNCENKIDNEEVRKICRFFAKELDLNVTELRCECMNEKSFVLRIEDVCNYVLTTYEEKFANSKETNVEILKRAYKYVFGEISALKNKEIELQEAQRKIKETEHTHQWVGCEGACGDKCTRKKEIIDTDREQLLEMVSSLSSEMKTAINKLINVYSIKKIE